MPTKSSILALAAALSVAGCKPRDANSATEAQQFARRILGPATDYRHVDGKAEDLDANVALRRSHAWNVAEEVLRPVTVDLASAGGSGQLTVANWQTWYDRTEFQRLFNLFYRCHLTDDDRQAFKDPAKRRSFDLPTVQQTLTELPRQGMGSAWTQQRFTELLGQLQSGNDLAGLNGVDGTGMSLYSPALVAHYIQNAAFVWACDGKAPPPAGVTGDVIGECFGQPFPADAAAVKPTFNRQSTGVLAFDTSKAALDQIFAGTGARQDSWNQGQTDVASFNDDASLSTIEHVTYRQGDTVQGTFLLTGLHITTKDVPDWAWVSLWWARDPGKDFGADRPGDFAAKVDPVYANYKLCTATTFQELDPVVTGGQDSDLPADLLASLRAASAGTAGATWCSNPFIEHMPHGARSNCIGCHQHGGPGGMPTATADHGPDVVKTSTRFPGDFMASFHGGKDDFQGIIQQVVADADLEGAQLDKSLCTSN